MDSALVFQLEMSFKTKGTNYGDLIKSNSFSHTTKWPLNMIGVKVNPHADDASTVHMKNCFQFQFIHHKI